MKLFKLFGKKTDTQPPKTERENNEDELQIYSGMRVEVTAMDGRMLFVAKLMGLYGNQAELHQYSEAAIPQEEPFPVRIRGYSDRDRKAVYMEGVISPLPQNKRYAVLTMTAPFSASTQILMRPPLCSAV